MRKKIWDDNLLPGAKKEGDDMTQRFGGVQRNKHRNCQASRYRVDKISSR